MRGSASFLNDLVEAAPAVQAAARLHDPMRLQALRQTGLLDSDPEPTFDRITRLVCRLLQVPVSLISLVDSDRQFFKSSQGLPEPVATARATPLSHSFCQHVVSKGEPLVVENAPTDALVCDNLAVRELGVRAYVGYPLRAADGEVIGSLCAIDTQPRQWSEADRQTVMDLAAIVTDEIALKTHMQRRQLVEEQLQFQALLLDTVQQAVIATDLAGKILHWNRYAERLYGWTQAEVLGRSMMGVTMLPQVAPAAQMMADLRQGESWSGEFMVRRRDGSTFPAHVTNSPFYDVQGNLLGIVGISRDISERKRYEAALLESTQRLRHVIDNLFTFVGLLTPDGILIEANRTALEAAALQPDDVINKPFSETYWWSYSSITQDLLRTAITKAANGQASRFDVRVRLGADHFIIIDFMLAPIMDEAGNVTFLVPSGLDITERKAAEVALQQSEEYFRSTFENAAVGIAHVAINGSWLRVNQRLCDIVGYTRAELLQIDFQTITHPDDLDRDLVHFQRLLAGACERYQLEKRYFHRDGHLVWIYLTVALQRDSEGNPLYAISVIEDISERKSAEARLHYLAEANVVLNSSLDYHLTLQQLTELLTPDWADWCAVDIVATAPVEASPAGGIKLHRLAFAHADPTKLVWLQELQRHFGPGLDSNRGAANAIRTRTAQFHPEVTDELMVQRVQDPQELALLRQLGVRSAIVVPLLARDTVLGALTLIRSQTERPYTEADLHFAEELARRTAFAVDNARLYQEARAAEAALLKLNETLELHVKERTAELERSNRELDQFAYVASHDLRAPLRAIDNLAAWIAEDAGALLPAPSREHLQKLQERIQRMENLLDDLLAYSRADRLHGQPTLVDSRALVQSVVQLFAPASTFQIVLPPTMPHFLTVRVPLETVFRNLIGNAIKHHQRPDGTIIIGAMDGEQQVTFTVSDDGPGIDPEFHERIFGMFQTLRPRDQVEGSGIGLAIVKKIVESLGGKIAVESTGGQGATFRFTWPKFEEIGRAVDK